MMSAERGTDDGRRRFSSRPIERVTVVGTGLMGTSVALAAARAGASVIGWDVDPPTTARAAAVGGFTGAATLEEAVEGAELVVVCTPIPMIADAVAAAFHDQRGDRHRGGEHHGLRGQEVAESEPAHLRRFVPGHPMGEQRSGPEHASASVLDGIVWVLSATGHRPRGRRGRRGVGLRDSAPDLFGCRPIVMTASSHS